MIRHAVLFGLLALIVAPVRAEDKVGESPLYPTKIGSTWNYKVGDKKLTTKVTKHETKGGLPCALYETMVDGTTVTSEHVAITKEGVVRTSYGGQEPEIPVMFLKFAAKNGESWTIDTKVSGQEIKGKFTRGEEDVEVPGYKGKAITSKGEFMIAGQTINFAFWFVEKKGIVKSQVGAGGQTVSMELESFVEGK